MNTALECMPCFMKMALRDARLASPEDEAVQRDIVMAWGRMIGELDLSVPPPAIARHLTELVRAKTGCGDLYYADKQEANARVLELMPRLKAMLATERERENGNPLALALEFAIIGNYIDRGVDLEVDWEAELESVSSSIDQKTFDQFSRLAGRGGEVLILGDNTGEIVLDMLLVEELKLRGCHVTYAVRSKPIINDATMEDARNVGMTRLCTVVESGVDTPGTVIDRCLPEFVDRMKAADIILSKGQGNFESLEGIWPGVFCAFKVKCRRVAKDSGLFLGSTAFCVTTPPPVDSAGN